MGDTDRKLFVLDTNILLHEPLAIYSFKEHDVVIPMTVLEELDRIKDSKRDVARDARVAIRALEHLFHDATPEEITEGIPLSKQEGATGTISILADYELDETVKAFTDKEGDNRILNAVLYLQAQRTPRAVVLVTKDINMRLRAKGAGVLYVEDYRTDQLIDDIQYLTKGFQTRPGSFWDSVEDVASYTLGGKTFHKLDRAPFDPTFLNQYVIDEDSDFAARVETIDGDTLTLRDLSRERMMHRKAWGITPKNIYQGMALDALLDPDIDLVILTGAAGSGKTLLAMAAALEQTVERKMFDKIIVTRNTPDIGESIGFLPGTEEEKMMPWLASVTDTLEALHKNDHCTDGSLKYICDKANIQFKSINFMRGRSIQNAFVLLDECQNLTASQIKTIITRCGEGTKIVCSGNLAQIDSHYLTPVTSGLTYMVERFKNFEGSANIHLNGVVRSRLAEFAEENL
ncbi:MULTISPECIES: PhoH family protein [Vibrio]|uniref:PhoH family protein n=1 Tax=Vibrio cholerae TaxID=666 RepID=A0A7Z7VMY0_VIBCL|nr:MULTISPECIES: PhoH family protein [Vibrio]EEY51616.1 phosphate starvation-inducible protein PhoH [Vibrio cholerae CT 5369-93]EEO00674.1 phosphate starvation-inducible protein PhoH [Vibrio cholerae 12129(1)]EGQ9169186.1 PhoH family protein [Vibrio cholerae]EGQ9629256.1 PhoH family protein [Vibrio cholerae]EGQ9636598.1 PhoH family protein [Vibrio cholerae]